MEPNKPLTREEVETIVNSAPEFEYIGFDENKLLHIIFNSKYDNYMELSVNITLQKLMFNIIDQAEKYSYSIGKTEIQNQLKSLLNI